MYENEVGEGRKQGPLVKRHQVGQGVAWSQLNAVWRH